MLFAQAVFHSSSSFIACGGWVVVCHRSCIVLVVVVVRVWLLRRDHLTIHPSIHPSFSSRPTRYVSVHNVPFVDVCEYVRSLKRHREQSTVSAHFIPLFPRQSVSQPVSTSLRNQQINRPLDHSSRDVSDVSSHPQLYISHTVARQPLQRTDSQTDGSYILVYPPPPTPLFPSA